MRSHPTMCRSAVVACPVIAGWMGALPGWIRRELDLIVVLCGPPAVTPTGLPPVVERHRTGLAVAAMWRVLADQRVRLSTPLSRLAQTAALPGLPGDLHGEPLALAVRAAASVRTVAAAAVAAGDPTLWMVMDAPRVAANMLEVVRG